MTTLERIEGMSLDEFMERMSDKLNRFEIINGEIIPVGITTSGHSRITMLLFLALHQFAALHNLGEAAIETVFALINSPKWVKGSRIPDVMFYRAERIEAYKIENSDWRENPYFLVPDLVAEIISANDSPKDVLRKVSAYLGDGVQIVWVIEPLRQQVIVFRADTIQPITLQATDSLDGAEVIPGFSMPVAALFV